MPVLRKHYVRFYSPGTFFSEQTEKEIEDWDVEKAKVMAHSIEERHAATPYGFRFITRERADDAMYPKEVAGSSFYYLGGEVRTYEEVVADNNPDEKILRENMKMNGFKKVITNKNSYTVTMPFEDDDVILDWSK